MNRDRDRSKTKSEFWEDVVLIFSVISLWPMIGIVKSDPPIFSENAIQFYKFLLIFIVAILIVILIRRVSRISKAFRETHKR